MSKSDAGKGDGNRSNSKSYRDNYSEIDMNTPPKAINPNIKRSKEDYDGLEMMRIGVVEGIFT